MDKKYKLLKNWNEYEAGTVLELDEATAKGLEIAGGYIEEWDATKEEKAKLEADRKEAEKKALDGVVSDAIKKAIESMPKSGGITVQVVKDEGDKPFKSFSEQMGAIKTAGKQGGAIDPRLLGVNSKASGLNETIDADGGFLIQTDFMSELQQKAFATGVLASSTTRIEIGPNSNGIKWNELKEDSRVDGSRRGGVQVYRTDEAATKTASKPQFTRRGMDLEKLAGIYYATDELLQDDTALAGMVSNWFGEEFGFKMDDEIMYGTGAGQMLGLSNSSAVVEVAKESGQTADTVVAANVTKMFSRLWPSSMVNAAWYINTEILPQLMAMTIGDQPVWLAPNGLQNAPFGILLGRPVIPIEHAGALGDKFDILLADFSQYMMIEKGGMQSASSIHVKFVEDETTFRFVMRNNGQPKWQNALTPYKGSATVSPFVTLAARA